MYTICFRIITFIWLVPLLKAILIRILWKNMWKFIAFWLQFWFRQMKQYLEVDCIFAILISANAPSQNVHRGSQGILWNCCISLEWRTPPIVDGQRMDLSKLQNVFVPNLNVERHQLSNTTSWSKVSWGKEKLHSVEASNKSVSGRNSDYWYRKLTQ